MATDQRWTGGPAGRQHELIHERVRPMHQRPLAFLGPILTALIIVPLVESLTFAIGRIWPVVYGMLIIGWVTTGATIAIVALGVGLIVTKRLPFVALHVAVTAFAWGVASAVTTAYWWTPVWAVIHGFGSLIFGLSWDIYRVDSLRAAAREGTGRDVWGELIGLRTSRPRPVTRPDDAHAQVVIEHGPGETRQDVVAAAKKMESAINAVAGRTTVTDEANGRAGTSLVTFALADVFAQWREWPGPSHPAQSFALPLRTAYYETGADQWFSLAVSRPSRLTPFRSEMDVFLGAVGTTGSGKSGFLNNLAAEILTRTDVILCWIDRAKIKQNAGWCLDMLGMAGDGPAASDLTKALRRLADYRAELFGQVALDAVLDPAAEENIGRSWTPDLAVETGEAAVVAIVDEADTAIKGRDWEWLSARGRSLGIFLVPVTPRASAAEVPAVVRGSVGAWKTFAIGDNYSGMFTLGSETMDAGADPSKLREPGLHYLDGAPGIEKRLWPVLAREYRSSTRVLRHRVQAAREQFDPAVFTPGALAAMGEHFDRCNPRRLLVPRLPENDRGDAEPVTPAMPYAPPGSPQQIEALLTLVASGLINATPQDVRDARRILASNGVNMTPADVEPADEEEEDDMRPTAQGVVIEDDEAAPVDQGQFYDRRDLAELAAVDPAAPISTNVGPDALSFLPPDKPVWTPEESDAELDRVLTEFYREGKTEFRNAEVMEAMRCAFSPPTVSRRLDDLAEGERIAPPGIAVERLGRGRFKLVASRPSPRPRG